MSQRLFYSKRLRHRCIALLKQNVPASFLHCRGERCSLQQKPDIAEAHSRRSEVKAVGEPDGLATR